jgi:hypothetical protein
MFFSTTNDSSGTPLKFQFFDLLDFSNFNSIEQVTTGVTPLQQKMAKAASLCHLFYAFSTFWHNWHGLTPIGVGPDHVIKGANQWALGLGNEPEVFIIWDLAD